MPVNSRLKVLVTGNANRSAVRKILAVSTAVATLICSSGTARAETSLLSSALE
jgi:hypothetical protein